MIRRIKICMIFAMLFMVWCFWENATSATHKPNSKTQGSVKDGLRINLSADRSSLKVGQEIRFRIEFINEGKTAFRIFENTSFVGENMVIKNSSGDRVLLEGGYLTWSPKAGYFTGRTVLLKPGARHLVRLYAYLDHKYRLVFSTASNKGDKDLSDVRKRLKVPADYPNKYIGDGRIFSLTKPGEYNIVFGYAKTEGDRDWKVGGRTPEESSTENIWLGAVVSNSLRIKISKS